MLTVLITLTTAGTDTGPFNLYSNIDGFVSPFETNVAKLDLESGYTSYLVPDSTTTIRVQSNNALCANYIDLIIGTVITTTSTSSTTTTTTTINPGDFDFYLADKYTCGSCSLVQTNVIVRFPTGSSVTINRYYLSVGDGDVYKILSTTSSDPSAILMTTSGGNAILCSSIICP